MKRLILFLILTIALEITVFAQGINTTGKEFWVAFMDNLDLSSNGDPVFSLILYSDHNAVINISTPSGTMHLKIVLSAGQMNEVFIPHDIYYSIGSEAYGDKGIKVTSDVPISVTAMHYRLYFCDASIVLPLDMLSTKYLAVAYQDLLAKSASEIVLVSTANNNHIKITTKVTSTNGKPPGTYTIILDAGGTFQVQSFSDLSGTVIEAEQKVAVFGGAKTSFAGCLKTADNHLWDEVLPVNLWGEAYAVIPFKNEAQTPVHIVALNDSTKVYSNCSLLVTLMQGMSYNFSTSLPLYLTSNRPIAVSELLSSQDCNSDHLGDPSFLNIMPAFCNTTSATFNASQASNLNNQEYFTHHYANVIVKSSDVNDFKIDGQLFPADSFKILSSNTNYSFTGIEIPPGYHNFSCSKGFQAYIYGKGDFDAYTYSTGTTGVWPSDNVNISLDDSDCTNIAAHFSVSNSGQMSNANWNFGDGTYENSMNTVHHYINPGSYTIEFTATDATGCQISYAKQVVINVCTNTGSGCDTCSIGDMCGVWVTNPGYQIFLRNADRKDISYIGLFDELGRNIMQFDNNSIINLPDVVSLQSLRPAIYFLEVICKGQKYTTKVLVIH